MARLVLLITSPRVAPGLLSRDAWSTMGAAAAVVARDGDDPTSVAVAESGLPVELAGELDPATLARLLLDRAAAQDHCAATGTDCEAELGVRAAGGDVVWLGSDDEDPGLTDALAAEVSRRTDPPDIEVLVGSYDVPGSRLLDLVAVMDRLRSPGGCPWDAQQTHESLAPYLIEEAHEAVEAIETGNRPHMVEELGDVLLQVAFHARIGTEDRRDPFDIDDVAAGIVAKLVRRHPHVFMAASPLGAGSSGPAARPVGAEPTTAAEVEAGWEELKAAEKPERSSVSDGIPASLPSLARAAKLLNRLERQGRGDLVENVRSGDPDALGNRLLALVLDAVASGQDPESALRGALRAVERVAG